MHVVEYQDDDLYKFCLKVYPWKDKFRLHSSISNKYSGGNSSIGIEIGVEDAKVLRDLLDSYIEAQSNIDVNSKTNENQEQKEEPDGCKEDF